MRAMRTPVWWRPDGPPRHLLAQPDAVAVPDLPLLLQVLRVRDAPGAPARARRGRADPRRRPPPPRQGAARAHGRGARPPSRRPQAPAGAGLRGLHGLRRVGVRAGARARPAAAHQPRRAQPRGARAPARGDRLAGPDARVGQPGPGRPPGLADQAPGAAAGDDPRRRRAADPVHERHPRRHRRVRGRTGWPRWRRSPASTTSRRSSSRTSSRTAATTARSRPRSPRRRPRTTGAPGSAHAPEHDAPGVGERGHDRRHEAPDRRGAAADARGRHPGPAEPRRLVARARARGRDRPRRPERQRRPHLARAPVPVARAGPRAAERRRLRAVRAPVRLPAVHRRDLAGAARARGHPLAAPVVRAAPPRRRRRARHDRARPRRPGAQRPRS